MKLATHYFSVLIIVVLIGCKQEPINNFSGTNEQVETLINNTWKLTNIGYDYNQNNKIDANESVIKSCEKDNEIAFTKNGTGTIIENQLSCSGYSSTNFQWSVNNHLLILSFTNQHTAQLLSLQNNRLVFTTNNHAKGNLITEFTQQQNVMAENQCIYTKNPLAQF